MGWRFYRRVSIIPGLRVNLSRSGPSLSIGGRGHWLTFGPRGRRVTVGWPGSGISYTQTVPPAGAPHASRTGLFRTETIPPAAPVHSGHRLAFVVVIVALGLLLLAGAHG